MDIELKPCPFCGGQAEIRDWCREVRVWCKKCKCGTLAYAAHTDYSAKQKAVEIWNRRVEGREITKEES